MYLGNHSNYLGLVVTKSLHFHNGHFTILGLWHQDGSLYQQPGTACEVFFKNNHGCGDWDRYLTHACGWHALHRQLLQAPWGPRQSPRQCMRCSRSSLCAQLLSSTLLAEEREMAHKITSSTLSARMAVIFQEVSSWTGRFIFTVLSGNKGYSRVSMERLWCGHSFSCG